MVLVKHRMKGQNPFASDEVIELLAELGNGLPRAVLQLCEFVCLSFRAKAEIGEPITKADVEALFSTSFPFGGY